MFKGCLVALITPFKDGQVDVPTLARLVELQIEKGSHGIVPCGTTGESATLTHEEHNRVIDVVIEAAAGRVPIIAGTGSNSTDEAIALTRHAKKAGAQGALLITPYYNRPVQQGMYQHFKDIADAVDIPIVVYNVPSRTGVNLSPETMGRLSRIDNIVGLKDAAGDLKQTTDTIEACEGRISILTGEDFLLLPMLAIGGQGGIHVISNIAPSQNADIYNAWVEGDIGRAQKMHMRLQELNRCMYLETNPIPVKWAAYRMGLVSDEIRRPMTILAENFRPRLDQALKDLDLIE